MSRRAYVDHAGATIPSVAQMRDVANSLMEFSVGYPNAPPLANPHSSHLSGQMTGDMIEVARQRILHHFNTNADEYSVIFTSNASASLKVVAETFDFGAASEVPTFEKLSSVDVATLREKIGNFSTLLMLQDSHTSTVGMRAMAACQQIIVLEDFDEFNAQLDRILSEKNFRQTTVHGVSDDSNGRKAADKPTRRNLFALTAMSNFCGRKYDLSIITKIHNVFPDWRVCLDAAALVGSAPLDLSAHKADFVAFSFYKMFGYPTGLGALLVRNDAAACLRERKRYFGGGAVNFASFSANIVQFRDNISHMFEDGTPNFYAIFMLRHGFDDLKRFGGISKISEESLKLSIRAYEFLRDAKHSNGSPVARVYGNGWTSYNTSTSYANKENMFRALLRRQGAIVNFNLLRDDETFVGYIEVEKMADLFGLELRTGCFCNQGACALNLRLNNATVQRTYELGKVCGDEMDLTENGEPVGSVRISFGRTSTNQDVDVFIQMIETCFITKRLSNCSSPPIVADHQRRFESTKFARLTHIFLYPVKSCAPIEPKSWQLSTKAGGSLRYDRAWMIVSLRDGAAVTQKRHPALCCIRPTIDESHNELRLRDAFGSVSELCIKLNHDAGEGRAANSKIISKVCSDNFDALYDYGGEKAGEWLTQLDATLTENCRIVGFAPPLNARISSESHNSSSASRRQNFSNQADFLLVSRPSLEKLSELSGLDYDSVLRRFRPNFVIEFAGGANVLPFEEDTFDELYIGSARFKVTGHCTRCQMICIDQNTGEKNPNVLLALRNLRKPVASQSNSLNASGETTNEKPIVAATVSGSGKLTFGVYLTRIITTNHQQQRQKQNSFESNDASRTSHSSNNEQEAWGRISVGCNVRIVRKTE